MSALVSAFVKNKPLSATIWVARTPPRQSEDEGRIVAKIARTSAGDLFTVKYMLGVPVLFTHRDSRRGLFIAYQPGEPPYARPCPPEPRGAPDHFPPQAPPEAPVLVSGLPCFHRKHNSDSGMSEIWYSYEYGAYARMKLMTRRHCVTDWLLKDVTLSEPPPDVFTDLMSQESRLEQSRNISRVAAEVFARKT